MALAHSAYNACQSRPCRRCHLILIVNIFHDYGGLGHFTIVTIDVGLSILSQALLGGRSDFHHPILHLSLRDKIGLEDARGICADMSGKLTFN